MFQHAILDPVNFEIYASCILQIKMSPAPPLSVLSLLLEALAVHNSCCKTQLESVVNSGIGAQLVCGYVLYLVLHKQYKFKNKFRNCH